MKALLALAAAAMVFVSCGNNKKDAMFEENVKALEEMEATPKQLPEVYDDAADPVVQIDEALAKAKAEGKFVIAQVGGNWCPWCLKFADYISNVPEICDMLLDDFVYIHVNVRRANPETGKKETCTEAMAKLGNPMRFGYPVMVVLDADGKVLHTQDSSFLESGESYDKDKVLRFFNNWKPSVVVK